MTSNWVLAVVLALAIFAENATPAVPTGGLSQVSDDEIIQKIRDDEFVIVLFCKYVQPMHLHPWPDWSIFQLRITVTNATFSRSICRYWQRNTTIVSVWNRSRLWTASWCDCTVQPRNLPSSYSVMAFHYCTKVRWMLRKSSTSWTIIRRLSSRSCLIRVLSIWRKLRAVQLPGIGSFCCEYHRGLTCFIFSRFSWNSSFSSYNRECIDCQRLSAVWEAVGAATKNRVNVARVDKDSTGLSTGKRFNIQTAPEFIL